MNLLFAFSFFLLLLSFRTRAPFVSLLICVDIVTYSPISVNDISFQKLDILCIGYSLSNAFFAVSVQKQKTTPYPFSKRFKLTLKPNYAKMSLQQNM